MTMPGGADINDGAWKISGPGWVTQAESVGIYPDKYTQPMPRTNPDLPYWIDNRAWHVVKSWDLADGGTLALIRADK